MNPMALPVPSAPTPSPVMPEAVVAPVSRWQALRQVGWWTNSDWFFLVVVAGVVVTGIFWKIFATPTLLHLAVMLLAVVAIFAAWLVTLVYRCMDFVLQLRANIEVLPFDAARIAVGFLQGGKPLTTPVNR